MKAYNKYEVDEIFSSWQSDLDRLDVIEVYTKSDIVAMLTELKTEIEKLDNPLDYDFEGYNQCAVDCEKLIQQKINSLKEAKDGENNN